MRLIDLNDHTASYLDASALTVGNFDGVHRGHAELFRQLKRDGDRLGLPAVAVTFDPHPLAVLSPEAAPPQITTFAQKALLIEEAGIDVLARIQFTPEFSRCPAEMFIRSWLCGALGMRHLVVGHDYAFGKDRLGNFRMLASISRDGGFTIDDIEPCGSGTDVFSSSLVRRRIALGDMPGAAEVLGRFHVISGRVTHGRGLGAGFGFPTANIVTDNELIPPDGVYAVIAATGGSLYCGACNIGRNPTVDGSDRTIEIFLLDFSGHLYDAVMSVCFVERLRDEQRFPGVDALVAAITDDVSRARSVLAGIDRSRIKPLVTQRTG